jgi:epoxyqueuosine reductase
MANDDPKNAIRAQALAVGFDGVGFARPELGGAARAELAEFLAAGRHGDMDWLARNQDRRGDPRTLWPATGTVIVVGLNYGPGAGGEGTDPLAPLATPERGCISAYARNRDYHDVGKKRLKQLGRWLIETHGGDIKVFVDTAPVMEKPLAQQAGLVWQGKHTNGVSRSFGSWLFLGELFTTLELAPDTAEGDYCGSCQRCLDVCPTDAFEGPYRIDARRCLSYLTIEHKGPIPAEFRRPMANRIYGCDDCLAVCPWNKFARPATNEHLQARRDRTDPPLAKLARLDDTAFRERFSGSPIKRLGRERFLRNVCLALGNSGDPELLAVVRERLADEAPLVRGAAAWALGELAPAEAAERAGTGQADPDPQVAAEWAAARGEVPPG